MSNFSEFSEYCRECGRHIDWHTGPHSACPDGIAGSRFHAIPLDTLTYQCAGCAAVLDPAAGHIVYITEERSYHCDGCAQRSDIAI